MVDHYQTLGVPPSASAQEIRAAYLALIKRHHPDAQQHPQGQEDARVRELNLAYAVLKDPAKRSEHDAATQMAARAAVHFHVRPGHSPAQAQIKARDRRNVPAFALISCIALVSVVIGAQSETTPFTLTSEAPEVEYAVVVPTRLPEVQPETAVNAYSDADYILARGSPADAARHSAQCFNELALSPGLELLDRCIAFDLAAAHWLRANARAPGDDFFSAAAMKQRHLSAFGGLSFGAATAAPRVAELRRLVADEAPGSVQVKEPRPPASSSSR